MSLGDPEELVNTFGEQEHLNGWKENSHLDILNLRYEVTPAELISMVISEEGLLPSAAVPAMLDIKHKKNQMMTAVAY